MNTEVEQILAEVGPEPSGTIAQWQEFGELPEFASESYVKGIDPLRRFLNMPPDVGGRLPSAEFYRALLAFGKATAESLLAAFCEALPDSPDVAEKYAPTWRAAALAARIANREQLISWHLNTWKPASADPDRVKVTAYVPRDLHAQARRLAFEAGVSLSAFTTEALAEKVEKAQRRKPAPAP